MSTAIGGNRLGCFTYIVDPPPRIDHLEGRIPPRVPRVVVSCVTQCFRSREIWGIDGKSLSHLHGDIRYFSPSVVRETLRQHVLEYVKVSRKALAVDGPLIIKMGASRIVGLKMALENNQFTGEYFDDDVNVSGEVETEYEALELADDFIKELYAQAVIPRD